MARSSTSFTKRPEGAGRKKGSVSKNPLTLDLVNTLRAKGHDPAAFQVEIAIAAWKRYKEIMRTKAKFGASSALDTAHKANAELLKYIYPTRKAVEGANGGALTVKALVNFLEGEIAGDNDEGESEP